MSSSGKSYKPSDAAYSYIEEGDDVYLARAHKFDHSFVEDDNFEKQARKGFIRRVYGILSLQLLVTIIMSASFMYSQPARDAVLNNAGFLWVGYILSFVVLIGLFFCRHQFPVNLIMLSVWTIIMSYTIGVVCAAYAAAGAEGLIMQAFAITMSVFVGLTIFTFQSKIDFSFLGAGLFACLWILIIWGIVNAFTGFSGGVIYPLFGSIIFSLYIVYDTWLLSNKLSYDEYILAAIDLYLDVLNLFLFILRLLSRRD